jgi:hypothetical protein
MICASRSRPAFRPRLPSFRNTVRVWNAARSRSPMPRFCAPYSTSRMIVEKGTRSCDSAWRRLVSGASRPIRYNQWSLRCSRPVQPGRMSSAIDSGTNTRGDSSVVSPVKPSGATPTIVIACPLMRSASPTIDGFDPNCVDQ